MTPEQQKRLETWMEDVLCQTIALRVQISTHIAMQRAEHLLARELKNKPDMPPEEISARERELTDQAMALIETEFQRIYLEARAHARRWQLLPDKAGPN